MTQKQLKELKNNFDKAVWKDFDRTLKTVFGKKDAIIIKEIMAEEPKNPRVSGFISTFKENYGQPDFGPKIEYAKQDFYSQVA